MKTIEQKARAYDEAIERARVYWKTDNDNTLDIKARGTMEHLFPELKESENEKIRKEIMSYIKSSGAITNKQWIAWLEKQGQSKQVSIWKHWKDGIAGNGEGKPIFLIKDGGTYRISSVLGYECDYIELSDLDELKQNEQKLTECIKFNNEFENQVSNLLASVLNGEHEYNESFVKYVAQSLLGYAKNELKPAEWSEEDERMYNIVFEEYKNRQYYSHPTLEDFDISGQILGWLKSLKDRVIPQQKSTWNEEDETNLRLTEYAVMKFFGGNCSLVGWLRKSLKQRIGG